MADRDYYETLGVEREATADQIKKAYRSQARKYHPDVNPGDKSAEAKFKEVQQAYDILSDAEKRSLYDRYGTAAFEGVGSAGPRTGGAEWAARAGGPGFQNVDFSEFFGPGGHFEGADPGAGGGSIFEEIVSRMRGGRAGAKGRSAPRQGQDLEAHLTIPFLTAVRGGETTIELEREPGKHETLSIKIPAGTEPGAKLRLRGRGNPGPKGSPAGDLTIEVDVAPHPYFHRDGRDLSVEVPITVGEAILGAKIEVPTPDGHKTLPIPAGSSSGVKLRLRGQGLPASGSKPAGDLFVVLKIVVPKSTDDESQRLIREFELRNPLSPRQGLL